MSTQHLFLQMTCVSPHVPHAPTAEATLYVLNQLDVLEVAFTPSPLVLTATKLQSFMNEAALMDMFSTSRAKVQLSGDCAQLCEVSSVVTCACKTVILN